MSGSWPALGEIGEAKQQGDGSPPTAPSPPDSAGEKVGGEIIDHSAELTDYDQQRFAAGKKRGEAIVYFLSNAIVLYYVCIVVSNAHCIDCLTGTGKQKWVPLTLDPPPSRPPPSKGPRRDRGYRGDRPHESRDHGRVDRDSYHSNKNSGYRDGYRGGRHHYEHRDDRDYHRGKWRMDRERYNVPPRWANQTGEEGEGRSSEGGRGYGGGYRGRGRWRYQQGTSCVCDTII